jgi:dienelactone hydrolase
MRFPTPVLVALLAAPLLPQERPPSRREATELCRNFLGLDARTEDGRRAQLEILGRLSGTRPLTERQERDWRKTLAKEQAKGRRLETGNRNHWWPDEKRGLYLVGGETGRPQALLIAMHGGGVGSGDAASAHAAYAPAAAALGWACVSPEVLEKTECGWTDSGTEEWVLDLIDAALRTWRIEPDRVYLAGHSMGGYGAWTLGAHHADRVAGLAPSAGAPTPILGQGGVVTGVVEGVIPNLRNTRIAIFQSTDDRQVPPEPNQKAVELLTAARQRFGGYDFDYWEVDDRGHGFPAGGPEPLLRKIADARRDPLPERLVWQPELRWKRQFSWLHWEHPTTRALVVADLDRENNRIAITCENGAVGDLEVLLDDRLVDMDREVVIEVNGEETRREVPVRTLSTLLRTSTSPDQALVFAARMPVIG